jgi:peptidyl-tRNA hydrolase PTH2
MQFIINTGHPHLSFSSCLLNIAQASFDLYDQIMTQRSQLLSFKTWHHHGELKQLFECNNGNQLREVNQQFEIGLEENQICTALINDSKYREPVCLAVFGIASYLEQYTSHLKRLQICPTKFFINDDDDNNLNDQENNRETSRK